MINKLKAIAQMFSLITDEKYLNAKWEYFAKASKWLIIFGALSSISYMITDGQLFGHFPWETLIPRCIIIVPLAYYLYLHKECKDYRLLSLWTLVMCHMIHWCTTWAASLLPDYSYVGEGILIMHLLFLGASYGTPFVMATVGHALILVNIIIPNCIMHWVDIEMAMTMNIPVIVGCTCLRMVLDKSFLGQYNLTNKLEAAMVTDALTLVYNRHKLEDMSEHGILKSAEVRTPMCLIMLDIDFFKRVNDTYGHDDGDKVLRYVAGVIKNSLRTNDLVVRWGGEEFVIILMHCNTYEGAEIAERLRLAIEQGDSGVCPLTISLGITALHDGVPYSEAVDAADTALYEAKHRGRNRGIVLNDGRLIPALEFLGKNV